MSQVVPLPSSLVVQRGDARSLHMEVSAHYMGRTDCPSVFRMEALLLGDNQQVLLRVSTPLLDAPADAWDCARLELEATQQRRVTSRAVMVVLHGKDSNFWRGHYGSKVTNCKVRILGTPSELEGLHPLVPLTDNRGSNNSRNDDAIVARHRDRRREGYVEGVPERAGDNSWHSALLAILCLGFLLWLIVKD